MGACSMQCSTIAEHELCASVCGGVGVGVVVWDKEVRTFLPYLLIKGAAGWAGLGGNGKERTREHKKKGWVGRRGGGQGTGDRGARASDLADLRPGSVQTFIRPPRFSLKQQPASQLALALKVLAPSVVLALHSSCHLALFAQEKLCKSLMHRVTSRHLSDASGSLSPVFKLTLLQPASQSSQLASFSSALVTSTQHRQARKGSRSPFPPEKH